MNQILIPRRWLRAIVRSNAGFTLLELMLVVILLGILAAITVPRLTGRSKQAAVAAARTDIDGTISVALDLYELDNGGYPTSDQGLAALYETPRSGPEANNWNGPYIKRAVGSDPWGNPYEYRSPGAKNSQGYDLWSLGPDGSDGTDDDITNW
jgi:general secretion pathway protein G